MQYGYIRNNTKSNRSGAHTEHNAQRSTRAHRGVRSRRSQNSVRVSVFYRLQVSFVISRSSRGVKHVLLLPLCFDFFLYCDIKITRAVRDASRRGRGSASPRGPSDRRPARQTVKVWVALIGAASPSGQRCALGEGERVLHKPRAGRDALSPRVGKQRLSAQSRRIGDFGRGAPQPSQWSLSSSAAPPESATQPVACRASPRRPGQWAVAPARRQSRQAVGASS
jgi:hypothetical protein